MSQFNNITEISLEGFQVVSGEMFINAPRKNDATCTLWTTSISFSRMSLRTLNNCERVRIEINTQTKGMLLVPVTIRDKDGVRWTNGLKEPSARKIECKQFASQLYDAWSFNPERAYRATGRIVSADKKVMLLFDFSQAESWNTKEKKTVVKQNNPNPKY